MITEQEVEKAAAYIRDHADDYAKAKAERIYLHEFRKSKKAMLINQAGSGTIQEKESFAYSHKEYIELLEVSTNAISNHLEQGKPFSEFIARHHDEDHLAMWQEFCYA